MTAALLASRTAVLGIGGGDLELPRTSNGTVHAEEITPPDQHVSSEDGNIRVTVNPLGLFTSITLGGGSGLPIAVSGGWAVQGTAQVASSVTATTVEGKHGLQLRQVSCLVEDAKNRSCTSLQVAITTTLLPEADTVNMTAEIEGVSTDPQTARVPWTGLVTLGFTFAHAGNLKIWAPWNRENSTHGADAGVLGTEDQDGLLPSFGGCSWPTMEMTFGNLAEYDFPRMPPGGLEGYGVAAEHVTVLSPGAGFSLIGDPGNAPLTLGTLALQGPNNGGKGCKLPAQCPGEAAFSLNFHSLKLQPGVVHRRHYSLFPHAACIRPGLGRSLAAFPEFWNPINTRFREQEGLGSFSEYPGFQIKSASQDNRYLTPLQITQMSRIGYKVAWVPDFSALEGFTLPPEQPWRWYPSDGNFTYARVNNILASGPRNGGIAMISYMNLFEYGTSMPRSPTLYVGGVPNESAPLNNTGWAKGGGYPYAVMNNFTQALITNGTCSGIYSGRTESVRCLSRLARSPERVAVPSWQGGILADPRDGLGYDRIVLADLQRHIDHLPAFQGVALDRMDYLQWVNFDGDDNYTFVGEGRDGWTGWPLKRSFLQITKRMRQMMGPSRTFMNNAARHSWLGMQRYQDGIFAELNNLNAYGFLGINATAIMWTTEESFGGKGGADHYFQRLIRMKVFPMAPFPQNDHATEYVLSTAPYCAMGEISTLCT